METNKFNAVVKETAKKDEITIFLETLHKREKNFNESYFILNSNARHKDEKKELSCTQVSSSYNTKEELNEI